MQSPLVQTFSVRLGATNHVRSSAEKLPLSFSSVGIRLSHVSSRLGHCRLTKRDNAVCDVGSGPVANLGGFS